MIPPVLSEAVVSVLTGVLAPIEIRASTRLGSFGLRLSSVTEPTLSPLNSTCAPFSRPETGLSK